MNAGSALARQLHPSKEWTAIDSTRSRHTLYAVLRQIIQLPDKQARSYLRSHALTSWRSAQSLRLDDGPKHNRWHANLHHAVKQLSYLRRANTGDRARLGAIFGHVYGRTGRRRHELLAPLIEPDTSAPRQSWKSKPPNPSPMLQALLKSQAASGIVYARRRQLRAKNLELKIPDENIWKRSFPVKRAVNMQIKWYHELCNKVIAPLPKKEWDRLIHLATRGPLPVEDEIPIKRFAKLQVKELVDTLPIGRGLTKKPCVGTPVPVRNLVRVWRKILSQSCYMAWNADRKEWSVTWGKDIIIDFNRSKTVLSQGETYEPS